MGTVVALMVGYIVWFSLATFWALFVMYSFVLTVVSM
jgi:hypothetical protein